MLNVLVETKNEYTTHLTNILTPLVFEGLQSVYKQSLDVAKNNDILKIFQSFLKAIPKWNQVMIEKETNRIINSSHSYGWLNDLIKATLKANLIVLMYNPTCKTQAKVEPVLYQNIKTCDFIHRVYIECARELWNNPYLLYHNYPPIEIKRNQRDCMNIIKDCIKEALRKLLPVKHILEIYLGEDIEVDKNEDQFEKALTDVEERNLTKIIQRDLADDKNGLNEQPKLELTEKPKLELNEKQYENKSQDTLQPPVTNTYPVKEQSPKEENLMIVNPENLVKSNTEEKTIGSRILNIINNNSVTSSDIVSILSSDNKGKKESVLETSSSETSDANTKADSSSSSDGLSASELKNSIKKFEATLNASTKPDTPVKPESKSSTKVETIDDKIKKVLQKDLATDSDLETSLNYSQEDNDNKYQEIFSNYIVSPKKISKDDSKNLKDKKKFFNNYLHF
jgi:hypothetical protein